MTTQWATKEKDLMTAQGVLRQYYGDTNQRAIGIQEVTIVKEGSIHIERADWVVELEELFEKQYGENHGVQVAQNVITTLLTQGQTIH
jgi:hypothetical protein